MKKLALCLLLAGCTTPPQVIGSNPESVTIQHGGSYQEATALAVSECAKYHKDAKLIHSEGWLLSFDCVKRE